MTVTFKEIKKSLLENRFVELKSETIVLNNCLKLKYKAEVQNIFIYLFQFRCKENFK